MSTQASIERLFGARSEGDLNFYAEHVDTTRLGDPGYVHDIQNLLRSKYEGRQLNLIFALGDVAVDFISKQRADFFPAVPIVFSTVDPVVAMPNSTGIRIPISQGKVLETAIRVHPDTQHVVIVAGSSGYDRYYVNAAREEFKPYEGRLAFTYLVGLPIRELLSRVATLPARSIVIFMGVTEDGDGRSFLPQEMLDSISAAANAPTYGWHGAGLDHGLVGGTVYSLDVLAEHLVALGRRVLIGERVETIPVTEVDFSTTQFDWRQLQRWNISESRLPVNSTILFKQPSAWELYRAYMLSGAVILILQTALIIGLVVQRARRRRTEHALRESELRSRGMAEQNQALAGRLINAQDEERSRIARELHDNLSQQMALLANGIDQLAMRPVPPAAMAHSLRELQQRSAEISTEVHNLSHRLHSSKLEMLGLVAAVRGHCKDVLAQGVMARFHDENVPRSLSHDASLCLFRIVQEGLNNVVKHSGAREAHVTLRAAGEALVLSIVDLGRGFDEGALADHGGLGLASMRERLRLIDGEFTIRSEPGQGTTITARVGIAKVIGKAAPEPVISSARTRLSPAG